MHVAGHAQLSDKGQATTLRGAKPNNKRGQGWGQGLDLVSKSLATDAHQGLFLFSFLFGGQ